MAKQRPTINRKREEVPPLKAFQQWAIRQWPEVTDQHWLAAYYIQAHPGMAAKLLGQLLTADYRIALAIAHTRENYVRAHR